MNTKNTYAPLELAPAQQPSTEEETSERTPDWQDLPLRELMRSDDPALLAAVVAMQNSVMQADNFEAIQGQRD